MSKSGLLARQKAERDLWTIKVLLASRGAV